MGADPVAGRFGRGPSSGAALSRIGESKSRFPVVGRVETQAPRKRRRTEGMKKVTVLCAALVVLALPASADFLVINEAFTSMTGTDTQEYVELCGTPGMDLSSYSLITIEGDSPASGLVDKRWNLSGVMPADGFFVIGCNAVANVDLAIGASDQFENGSETILLVQNCTVATGTDVDTDNNCVEEIGVGTVVAGVAFNDAGAGDCTYFGAFVSPPDGTFRAAGIARCTDCVGDFRIMCFNITGCDVALYSNATPGVPNDCPFVGTEDTSWGSVKNLFR
jgi:hypothetical protein